ncbi:hypothetical protein FWK35_00009276, partial [Aphis craccivora]
MLFKLILTNQATIINLKLLNQYNGTQNCIYKNKIIENILEATILNCEFQSEVILLTMDPNDLFRLIH